MAASQLAFSWAAMGSVRAQRLEESLWATPRLVRESEQPLGRWATVGEPGADSSTKLHRRFLSHHYCCREESLSPQPCDGKGKSSLPGDPTTDLPHRQEIPSRHSLLLQGSPPSGKLLIPLNRRDVRVVEGARLENDSGDADRVPKHLFTQSIQRLPAANASRCDPVNVGACRSFRGDLTQFLHSSDSRLPPYVTVFIGKRSSHCAAAEDRPDGLL